MNGKCTTCGQSLTAERALLERDKAIFKLKLVCKQLSNADNIKIRDQLVEENQTAFRTSDEIQKIDISRKSKKAEIIPVATVAPVLDPVVSTPKGKK